MTREAVKKRRSCVPTPRTVLVAAFPYYAGERGGNLSIYARGLDYHTVVTRRLNTICDFLKEKYENQPVFGPPPTTPPCRNGRRPGGAVWACGGGTAW